MQQRQDRWEHTHTLRWHRFLDLSIMYVLIPKRVLAYSSIQLRVCSLITSLHAAYHSMVFVVTVFLSSDAVRFTDQGITPSAGALNVLTISSGPCTRGPIWVKGLGLGLWIRDLDWGLGLGYRVNVKGQVKGYHVQLRRNSSTLISKSKDSQEQIRSNTKQCYQQDQEQEPWQQQEHTVEYAIIVSVTEEI
jgi:hypothetical protein